MTVSERIEMALLLEKMKAQPEQAKILGLEEKSKFKEENYGKSAKRGS